MLVAAPPIIETRLERAGPEAGRCGLELARARFEKIAARSLELFGAGVTP